MNQLKVGTHPDKVLVITDYFTRETKITEADRIARPCQ